jgi:sulfonate transport system substrate-binding protein
MIMASARNGLMACRDNLSPFSQGRSWMLLLTLFMCLFSLTACQQEAVQSIQPGQQDLTKHPVYSQYQFGHDEKVIDIGIQPMWMPVSVIVETMRHDETLQESLKALGMEIRFHAFAKGSDINFFLQRGDLDAGIGGDMPALLAAAKGNVLVASMIQQGFVSIMSGSSLLLSELRGKRIAFAPASNAHFALLNALFEMDIDESEVNMVAMDVNEMPEALKRGEIDLFASWEPMPTIAGQLYGAEAIYRSLSTGYLYFSRQYAERHPDVPHHLIASQIRSITG